MAVKGFENEIFWKKNFLKYMLPSIAHSYSKISGTARRMTMKFLPDVKLSEETGIQKEIWHKMTSL